ncbi:MAG: hypothetical protein V4667_04100 [Bacteroidota bacterium]
MISKIKFKFKTAKVLFVMLFFFSFNSILLAQDGELTAQIVFSDQPFMGTDGGNKLVTDFKAGSEIYARIKFEKPMNDLFKGNFSGAKLKVNTSDGLAKLEFKIKYEKDGEIRFAAAEKNLSAEDLNLNYVDFDIAPSLNKSRDAYRTCFANVVASSSVPYVEGGEKGKMKILAFFINDDAEQVENVNIGGDLIIDYSDPKLDLNAWSEQIERASNEDRVAENKKKMGKKANIEFANLPFSNPAHKVATKFKAGTPIYGRVTLEKPLKEYLKVDEAKWIYIKVNCSNYTNINGLSHQKKIRPSELENSYIDFDVTPTGVDAKDVYDSNMGFHFSFFSNNEAPNKVVSFEVELEEINNDASFARLKGFGPLELDYTGLTATQVGVLSEAGRTTGEAAIKNADKMALAEGAEMVKKLPLPLIFSQATKAGYAEYPSAVITQMIKSYLKITEVYMLTYGENKEQGEFFVEKDSYNLPTAKVGNITFYFIFKDTDGYYKANAGYLIRPYEGGGKYGAPYIKAHTPITTGDASYPLDIVRDKNGFNYCVLIDGAKVKK